MKRFLTLIFSLSLVTCLGFWGVIHLLDQWSLRSIPVPVEVVIELKAGMPVTALGEELERLQLIDSAVFFRFWMRFSGGYNQFQAGNYSFSGEISPSLIKTKMKKGETFKPLALSVTIPEGFTIKQLNERLAAKSVASHKELKNLVHDVQFQKELGLDFKTLEGFTYPATYTFETLPSAKEFYAKVVKTFFARLPIDYEQKAKAKGLSLLQAVTFASLIELETMQESEKPMIAEVIWRRLQKNDALGIDAAVIYGIDNYKGDITWAHLKDTKNPYNTRVHRGLPPTPIGAPSRSSLEAVLNPSNLGYYYYMLDATDPTKHLFSRTLQEHNRNVQKYLKNIRR